MSAFRLLIGIEFDVLRDPKELEVVHPRYREAIGRGLLALEEGDVLDRDSDALLRAFVLLPCSGSAHPLVHAVELMLGCVGRREHVHRGLAVLGFHRIGRIDDVGRRSLWLREERDAVELRSGREGVDDSVRVTRGHPLFREICGVLSSARFAAEWEDPRGGALESSYVLDRHPSSIHCDDGRSGPALDPASAKATSSMELPRIEDDRLDAISAMLARGHSYVSDDGGCYVVERDELASLVGEVVEARALRRRRAELDGTLEAHRDALAVLDALGADLDSHLRRFIVLAAALARSGDRRSREASVSIVRSVRLLRGDRVSGWSARDREVIACLATAPVEARGSTPPRELVVAVLAELLEAIDRSLSAGERASASLAVQSTPEACARAHGQSCLSCGFTEEIRREMRSSDLSDAEKILRELARVLGMDAMSDVNVTFLGGAILTEVRRLRSPSAG